MERGHRATSETSHYFLNASSSGGSAESLSMCRPRALLIHPAYLLFSDFMLTGLAEQASAGHICAKGRSMSASHGTTVFISEFIRKLRGGSQPVLVRGSDGFLYVAKFANNQQGPSLLFNESAGTELYRACGLPVPNWTPLWTSDSFLDRNPDCWMQTTMGRIRPASGLCFGSQFLEGNGKRLFEILPGSMLKRVRNRISFWLAWLIDVCADHVGKRQAIFEEDADGWLNACFVDHGHLFGGPRADFKRRFGASQYFDERIYGETSSQALLEFRNIAQFLDADGLRLRIEAIPVEWGQTSARERFEICLKRLTTPFFARYLVDMIISDNERTKEAKSGIVQNERVPLRKFWYFR